MSIPTVVEPELADELGKTHSPIFVQGFNGLYDLITPLNLSDHFIPTAKPTIYFSAKEDNQYYYLLYCVYHFRDWTTSRSNVMQALDSHEHDLEGVLLVVHRDKHDPFWGDPCPYSNPCVSVFHRTLFFRETEEWRQHFAIEAEGHGIVPGSDEKYHLIADSNCIYYKDYRLENINTEAFQAHVPRIKSIFNPGGVHWPDQWNHWLIRRKFGKRSDGLIYTDPQLLFKYARKCQLMK